MSLLKEFSRGDQQADLKSADGSDAGSTDITNKAVDVKFSLMRNMINRDGDVSGSDVNNYLERAQDLNDEVDTVGFAVETDEGDMIKIYVAAAQAEEFEQELSKLLGLDSDSESAINTLAQKFDIVDVVWPTGSDGVAANPDDELSIDDESLLGDIEPEPETTPPGEDNPDSSIPADDMPEPGETPPSDDEEGELDADEDETSKKKKKKKSLMKDVAGDEDDAEDDAEDKAVTDEVGDDDSDADAAEADDVEEPVLDDDGNPKLDDNGDPVMKKAKKKKKKADKADDVETKDEEPKIKTEEGLKLLGKLAENARAEITAHVAAAQERGVHGKWLIGATVTGGTRGRLQFEVKKGGKVWYFDDETSAMQEAERLSNERNVAGAKAHFSYTPKLVEEEQMSAHNEELDNWKSQKATSTGVVGTRFLTRVLEADEAPGVKKLDTAWKGVSNHMKRPYEKKIITLFHAIGIPGRLVASEDGISDSIIAGGAAIRRPGRKQTEFNKFFDLFTGGSAAPAAMEVPEAKKRGGRTQKVLETVLIHLGLPAQVTTSAGSGTLGTVFSRATRKIEANEELNGSLFALAKAFNIKSAEINEELDEDIDTGNDVFFKSVVELAVALGIPEQNLQYQRPSLIKSMRTVKLSLGNRSMIESKIAALMQLVKSNTKVVAQQDQNKLAAVPGANESILRRAGKNLMEAFSPLEALTSSDLKNFNALEPNSGPAMMAAYEGGGTHEETILMVAVDPDADDDVKSLRVGIDGPWDGTLHNKYFPNNKDGYKAAVEYANMLRTANLKTGGRPKGWKN